MCGHVRLLIRERAPAAPTTHPPPLRGVGQEYGQLRAARFAASCRVRVDQSRLRSSYGRNRPHGGGQMQYMLLIYNDETWWERLSEEEGRALMGEYFAYTDDLRSAGAFVSGEPLQPTTTAKTVNVRDGERFVSDGPFAETKEQLGGFYLIDVDSPDAALEWAAKIPSARVGRIEVR